MTLASEVGFAMTVASKDSYFMAVAFFWQCLLGQLHYNSEFWGQLQYINGLNAIYFTVVALDVIL